MTRFITSMRSIANDPERLHGVLEHYAEVLQCGVADLGGAG